MAERDAAESRNPETLERESGLNRAAAYGVHLFTASGVVLGFLALVAAVAGDYVLMFVWLGVALFVDGVDGSLARKARVGVVTPRISGESLDLVVDYVTYVLVPAYALATSGLLPTGFGLVGAGVICLTSALYFSWTEMKTDDLYFRGFPAVWNLVAFYLFVLAPPPYVSLGIVLALAALTFAPIAFVHPFRVKRLRIITLALLAAWGAFAVAAVVEDLKPNIFVISGLITIALYFSAFGLFRASTFHTKG